MAAAGSRIDHGKDTKCEFKVCTGVPVRPVTTADSRVTATLAVAGVERAVAGQTLTQGQHNIGHTILEN